MKNETKEKNFALRLIVRHFINNLSEDYKVYVYFSNGRLIYIDGEIKNIFKIDINIYETTLKNLYLYLFIEEYGNVDQPLLVYLANKELKRYSSLDIQQLLNVSAIRLNIFEGGRTDFTGDFSYENIALKMGFNKSEFNQTFNQAFRKVK